MTSGSIRIERSYPAGHRNRHTPHLCRVCAGPLTADGSCTRCAANAVERPVLEFPNRRARLERMERTAAR